MAERPRVSLVGGGNMAEALIRGLLASGIQAEALRVSDPSEARRAHLEAQYGVETSGDNALVAREAEIVILAVKPTVVPAAAASIADQATGDTLVISLAAGVSTVRVEGQLKPGTRVVRAMPNTPALVQAGATAVAKGRFATPEDLQTARALFQAVGEAVILSEDLLDAVTGLSGSGPAYVMLAIEALADGGVEAGLPRATALMLAAQTVYGAAKLQIAGGDHPGVLKDRVTSPGGTTIAGVRALEARGFRSALIEAVAAASERARKLGQSGDETSGRDEGSA